MSVMIIRKETFEKIAATINFRRNRWHFDYPERVINNYVRSWFVANYESYGLRYNEDVSEYLAQELDFKFYLPMNDYQLLKSLHCIRYNIEHDEFEKTADYEVLGDVIERLTSDIIQDLPEYEEAEWG